MRSLHTSGQIEILESRIAPATIFVGSAGENDTEYKEPPGGAGTDENAAFVTPFIDTDPPAVDPISTVVGPGAPGPDTFYVQLTTGDAIWIHTDVGYVPFISGLGGVGGINGNVVAFFVDKNLNNEVDADELTGLALGDGVSLQVSGSVDGDILSNYNDDTFSLGGAGEPAGTAQDLLLNPINALVVTGNVAGSVVSGGVINQVKIVGSVESVLTGKAANGFTYNFFDGAGADGGDTLVVTPGAGVKGVNITNLTIGSLDTPVVGVVGRVEAGGGGAGAEGGSITNVTILGDTTGLQILAGAGGDGAAGKTSGGPGGRLTDIVVNGPDENQGDDASQNDQITIRGGNGGLAFAASGGKGGDGGALQDIYVGYERFESGFDPSTNALQDAVEVSGGVGGAGKTGGKGANLTNINVIANPTGAGNDIEILGGLGGANNEAVKGGKAGIGGALNHIDAQNPPQDPTVAPAVVKAAKIIVKGGDGGATMMGFGAGAAGGAVTDLHLIGYNLDLRAGHGSIGISGGVGGDLTKIIIDEGYVGSPNAPLGVRAESVIIDAGAGGRGTVTKGAAGGSIRTLKISNADFTSFLVNQTAFVDPVYGDARQAANGGTSFKGAGAAGGSLSDFDIVDIDSVPDTFPPTPNNNEATMMIRAGNGGNGGAGNGGNGGALTGDDTIFAVNASLVLNGGIGGNAAGKGKGGNGGDVRGFGFFSTTNGLAALTTATVTGGNGGDGILKGAGGLGGSLVDFSLNAEGAVVATSGNGGMAGAGGAAGKGGDISLFSGLSRTANINLIAGDAGAAAGVKAGDGGAISEASLRANTSILVLGGDGRNGGAGGGISVMSVTDELGNIGPLDPDDPAFDPLQPFKIPGPGGPVTITSGAGSAMLKAAGAGGNITNVSGVIAATGLTQFTTGTVVVTAGATKSASGGSIDDINLFGGGGVGAEVRVEAGDAADVPNAKKGADGGSVSNVQIGSVFTPGVTDPATIIRQFVAGDGGDVTIAKGVGGTGGSVTDIRVGDDIGVRSGSAFGYNGVGIFNFMGGIFAGKAGTSGAGGKAALAGNVIGISADAIASIVAGKLANGVAVERSNLVQTVDAIVLNGDVASKTDPNGTYTNFATANIVGAVVNPNAVGVPYPVAGPHANTFDAGEYGDVGVGNAGVFGIGDTTNGNTDGFVAAVNFSNDSATPNNFRVEALLTVDPVTGASVFIDLNNLNGQVHS